MTTTWFVVSVDRVVDGDTVRLIRTRDIGTVGGLRITATDGTPVAVRLLWVDTPERGETGWAEARADLTAWAMRLVNWPLTLVEHGPDHFGRILGDLQDQDGNSASQWLIRERGWAPYIKAGRA